MLAVDDRLETHIGRLDHQQIDFLADRVGGRHAVQVTIQARGGGDAFATLVDKHVDHTVVTDLQRPLFFRMGQQQIFRQSPVEE
ncbi:hypothetical protein D3C80_1913680 [compost metagenome]